MSNTFLTLVKRAFDLSQKPFRPRPKTKEVSKNDINIHIIAYYTISNTTLGRDSLSVVYIYELPIIGFLIHSQPISGRDQTPCPEKGLENWA